MSVQSGQSITVLFTTRVFATGVGTNADSLPTGTLYVNGVANAATVTVTNLATGKYKAQVTLPTLAIGDEVELTITATVSTITDSAVIWGDTKDLAIDASGDVTFNNASIGSVTGAVGSVTGNVGGNVVGSVGSVTAAVVLPSIPAGWITGTGIAAGALNGKGDWLLAANYVTPPTTAQIAAAVWDDPTAGGDFSVAGSIGKLIVTDVVTAIPTPAQVASAIWQDPTAGADFAVAGSIGKLLSSGTLATVNGYSTGQDPATLVWNAVASAFNTAGSMGQKLNAAGGAADPLTNPVPGNYAAGTAGYEIAATYAKVSSLGAGQINYVGPVNPQTGSVLLYIGDDYKAADGRALQWTNAAGNWPNLTSAAIAAFFKIGTTVYGPFAGSVITPTGANQQIQVELSSAQTSTLGATGTGGQSTIDVVATLSNGDKATLVDSAAIVLARH